jgi:hypothetical protein
MAKIVVGVIYSSVGIVIGIGMFFEKPIARRCVCAYLSIVIAGECIVYILYPATYLAS